jgi:hypothetical protein
MRLVEEGPMDLRVFRAVEGQAERWATIPPRAPRFLVVVLKGARELIMDHEAHIRAVNAHAEGIGRHNHGGRGTQEPVLNPLPLRSGQPRVIAFGMESRASQRIADPFHPAA